MRRSPIAALAAVAYAVILGDLLSKLAALALVGQQPFAVSDWIRLVVVHNDAAAFGLPLQELGLEASTVVIFLLIVLMLRVCRELSQVDRLAPVMLGLIAGAGAANHMDMLVSPHGVVDFIAFGHIVFNVADMALVAGLALCARTAWLLVARIAEQRAPSLALATGVNGDVGARGAGDLSRRSAAQLRPIGPIRPIPLFREPEAAMMMRAVGDAGGEEREVRIESGRERTGPEPGRGRRSARMLDFSGRFDRAATPALVIAGSFILLYSLAIVWLPDAGRSAPNAILLALGVFGSVFLAVYVDLVVADRRAEARRESSREPLTELEVGIEEWPKVVHDSAPDAPGDHVHPGSPLHPFSGGNGDELNREGRS